MHTPHWPQALYALPPTWRLSESVKPFYFDIFAFAFAALRRPSLSVLVTSTSSSSSSSLVGEAVVVDSSFVLCCLRGAIPLYCHQLPFLLPFPHLRHWLSLFVSIHVTKQKGIDGVYTYRSSVCCLRDGRSSVILPNLHYLSLSSNVLSSCRLMVVIQANLRCLGHEEI